MFYYYYTCGIIITFQIWREICGVQLCQLQFIHIWPFGTFNSLKLISHKTAKLTKIRYVNNWQLALPQLTYIYIYTSYIRNPRRTEPGFNLHLTLATLGQPDPGLNLHLTFATLRQPDTDLNLHLTLVTRVEPAPGLNLHLTLVTLGESVPSPKSTSYIGNCRRISSKSKTYNLHW